MRVVDQIIEYAREQGMLSADDLERLAASGFVKKEQPETERPVDGRWTERHWRGTSGQVSYEERDGDRVTFEEDETEEAIQASKAGRRGRGASRGKRWSGRRARRVRRSLARTWRQA